MKNVKERLVELREKNDLTKVEMAKRIGVNKSTITRYETGEMKPTLDVLIETVNAFGVSLDWLAGFDVDEVRKYEPTIKECIESNITPDQLKTVVDAVKGVGK